MNLPTFADIEAAAARIAPYAFETPLIENAALNARMGRRVFLKAEPFQRTGSFKFRGACNRILLIPERERKNGVVAFSSGNHAQGVAAAAQLFGVPATIVMPLDAPRIKVEGTKSYGATVLFYDRRKEDREAIAGDLCAKHGSTLVRPFDDAGVIAGQGTIGLETARALTAKNVTIDEVFVPCGGGGLLTGTALAITTLQPSAKVIGVEPYDYDGMRLALAAGEPVRVPAKESSIADSLLPPMAGKITLALARKVVSRIEVARDDDFARAVSYSVRTLKIVAEPGGAAGLAALLRSAAKSEAGAAVVVISGGNCDPDMLARCCASFPEP
jgi:threonine dehydratase